MEESKDMTLEEFTKAFVETLQERMEEQQKFRIDPDVQLVKKTNIEKAAVMVRLDEKVGVPIYTEDLYQQFREGLSVEEIADRMVEVLHQARIESPEIPDLTAENARERITLTLVNAKMNTDLLETVPHYEVAGGELAAVPRWYISEEASFLVTSEMARQMKLTPEEVLQIGKKSIDQQDFKIRTMQEIIAEMMGDTFMDAFPPLDGPPMIVLTNERGVQGANALLSEKALAEVERRIGSYVVLPSSLHEVICIPIDEKMDPDTLRSMVREVNLGQVAPEERLSDEVFMCDGHRLMLVGDTLSMETQEVSTPEMDGYRMRMAM